MVCVFTLHVFISETQILNLLFNLFQGWKKGVVFINGRILGRYWDVGPQKTLYLPGPWLQPGSNEVNSSTARLFPSALLLNATLLRGRT